MKKQLSLQAAERGGCVGPGTVHPQKELAPACCSVGCLCPATHCLANISVIFYWRGGRLVHAPTGMET